MERSVSIYPLYLCRILNSPFYDTVLSGVKKEERVVHAVPNAQRIALAQVTGDCLFGFRMNENGVKGACLDTDTTPVTSLSLNDYHA
jgi:hypothetical protein